MKDLTLDGLLERGVAEERDGAVLLRVKAVPGAARSEVAGVLGDRLKVRVAPAPEGGKANKAVCELLARMLGVKKSQVAIESGHTAPEKTIRITP